MCYGSWLFQGFLSGCLPPAKCPLSWCRIVSFYHHLKPDMNKTNVTSNPHLSKYPRDISKAENWFWRQREVWKYLRDILSAYSEVQEEVLTTRDSIKCNLSHRLNFSDLKQNLMAVFIHIRLCLPSIKVTVKWRIKMNIAQISQE